MALETAPLNGARYAAMEAAEADENQPFTSDFLHLKRGPGGARASDTGSSVGWSQRLQSDRRLLLRTAVTACFFLIAAALLVGVIVVAAKRAHLPSPPQSTFSSWCLTPLGGGLVGPGGSFGHYNSSACTAQLEQYFAPQGAYIREVELVAAAATAYFLSRPPADPTQLVIFDIDETVLSNQASFFSAANSGQLGSAAQVAASQATGTLPVLSPMLQLYRTLYRLNYSVAFVTGRDEPQRQPTVANLAAAGFGAACASPSPPPSPPAPTAKGLRRSALQKGSRAAAGGGGTPARPPLRPASSLPGAVAPATSAAGRPAAPCYSALLLRPDSDARFASVVKPEARGVLVQLGYEVVGNLGDQFSDLVGSPSAAPGSFKLPNPVYYTL